MPPTRRALRLLRHLREQGTLEQTDLTKKLFALLLEHAGAPPLHEGAGAERDRGQPQDGQREPHDARDHLDELLDGPRDRVAAVLGCGGCLAAVAARAAGP
jgi:hypothetical protein